MSVKNFHNFWYDHFQSYDPGNYFLVDTQVYRTFSSTVVPGMQFCIKEISLLLQISINVSFTI